MAIRPVFDWTINLGHVLTFVGFITTGFIAYAALEKRVALLEQERVYQVQRDVAQDAANATTKNDIREALRDLNVKLDKLGEKLDQRTNK